MAALVHLYFTKSEKQFTEEQFHFYCNSLPANEQGKIKRFKRWQDAQLSLLGKMLLREAVKDFGIVQMKLEYTAFNRPYFGDSNIDFNIAHSGEYVVCLVSGGIRVGVDIEKIKPVDLEEFTAFFSPGELASIRTASDQQAAFFKTWTRKEALIKADGQGVSLNLATIDTLQDIVPLNGVQWHLQPIQIDSGYVLHVCTSGLAEVQLKSLRF